MAYDSEKALHIELTALERRVLRAGLVEWSGPTRPTDALARAMGFRDIRDLGVAALQIADALSRNEALPPLTWARALLATEIAFASDVFGSGYEWSLTTGIADAEALKALRSLQRKLVSFYNPEKIAFND